MSKRKRTSRNGRRKVRRNRYVLVANARGALRRLARNVSIGGIDVMEKIVFPALGATGGILLAQFIGSKAPGFLPGQDPRLIALGASSAVAYGAYMLGESLGLSPETQMTVAAGAGVAGILPLVPASMLPMLPAGSMNASASTPPPNAVSGYYQRSMLSGLMVDVSHAGAPFKGMFGLGAYDGGSYPSAVSLVEPIDMALPAKNWPEFRPVTETMGTPQDRGWAGGSYARNIFSGGGS